MGNLRVEISFINFNMRAHKTKIRKVSFFFLFPFKQKPKKNFPCIFTVVAPLQYQKIPKIHKRNRKKFYVLRILLKVFAQGPFFGNYFVGFFSF